MASPEPTPAPAPEQAPAAAAPAAPAPAERQDGPAHGPSHGHGHGGGDRHRRPNRPRGPRQDRREPQSTDADGNILVEKTVFINRCAKVVKGGRRFSFSALIVAGDRKGRVGVGFGKAREVSEAIRKGGDAAKKSLVVVVLKDATIPHEVLGEHGGGRVLLRPASPGTGVIAGGGVRAVVEAAGVRDVLAKSLGSNNPANVVKATLAALQQLRSIEQIRLARGRAAKTKE
jgi:small subunit ribosomal protein S5